MKRASMKRTGNKYQYQVRDIGGSDVYYKKKVGDKFWKFIDKDEFENLSEPLIFYTSFISVSEMDAFAAKNDIIIQAGDAHTFRTHKTDESIAEITSSPFALDTTHTTYHFILEVFKLKIYHFWNTYIPYFNETRLEDLITLQLASILKVNPYSTE